MGWWRSSSLIFSFIVPLALAFFPILASTRAIAGAALVGTYFSNALGKVAKEIEDFRPFSVFYGSAIENSIDWASVGGVTLVAFLLVLLAALAFSRRDVYT